MASSFTTNYGFEEIATGEQSGTWGTTTNFNYDILDRIASYKACLLYTSPSPRDGLLSRMPSSA